MSTGNTAPDLSIILAGERVPVSFHDGSTRGVFVCELPARFLLTNYMLLLTQNEAVLLENVCRKVMGDPDLPNGWIDCLTDASHIALIDAAERLNFARAASQAERQGKRMQGLKFTDDKVKALLGI